MNRTDFYLKAIAAKAHYDRDWVIRAFSRTVEDPEAWKERPAPWRVVQQPQGIFFVNEKMELEKIDDAKSNEALFRPDMILEVPPNYFEHWPQGGDTTPCNLLFNATALWPSVGGRYGYMNSEFNFEKLQSRFTEMQDDPANPADRKEGVLYVSDYKKFCNALIYLEEFTQLFTVSITLKAVTPPPGVKEFKAKLLEKYKDNLNDPLTQTKIYKEIVAFAKEHLKGDPSERFLISGKSLDVIYRKLFLIFGAEPGLDTSTTEMPLIKNSLSEGWELERLPDMINTSRAGSYDRGSETELGGVVAKWLERATANVRVVYQDCGSKLYKLVSVNEENVHRLVGKYLVDTPPKMVESEDEARSYLGKVVRQRAPHFCNLPNTDYCHICLGRNLSANPDAPSIAANSYGGNFLGMFLASMHAKELKTAIIDLDLCIS